MNQDIREAETSVYAEEQAVEIREGIFPESETWWRRVARWSLYAIALTTPLLFLPSTIPPTFIKQVAVSLFAFIAFISWLGESLLSGRIYYKRSVLNPALGALLLVLFISTLTSAQALRGLVGIDDVGERFMSFLVFAVIFFVAGGVFYTESESRKFVWWFLSGGVILSILSLLQFFAPSVIPFSALARSDVSTVGTANAIAVMMGFYFLFAIGILVDKNRVTENRYVRIGVGALLVLSLLNLIVINFRYVWIGVAVGVIVLLGLQFRRASKYFDVRGGNSFLKSKGFGLLFLMLVITIFFTLSNFALFSSSSLIGSASIPVEVSPSFQATLNIAAKTLKNYPLLGSGPGTFGIDYSLYRDPQINQTTFWGIRFNSGASFLTTLFSTVGALGALALIAFSVIALFSLLRNVAKRTDDDPLLSGGLAAVLFGFLMWWLYSTSFTSQVALFAVLGIMVSRMNEVTKDDERKSFWRISERQARFTTPWSTFATSLVIIFLMVGGVAFLYYTLQQYVSAVYFARGVTAFNTKNDIAGASQWINQAVQLNPNQDTYYRALAQISLSDIQAIVNSANAGSTDPSLQNRFRNAVQAAIRYGEQSTEVNKQDALNWSSLGFVYQSLVPLLAGAENRSFQYYDEAIKWDSVNPTYTFSKASVYMAVADKAQTELSQLKLSAEDTQSRIKLRTEALESAKTNLGKSIQLKPDYPQSNYLLAQVLIRQGNLQGAIKSVETVRDLGATNDIGVAFQLGVLYYQNSEFDKAEGEFARAVAINDSYSNARYFLGLLYDRKGDKVKALVEFKKIESFNPDNQEVKTIIANISAGKPALNSISPPAPPPSQRQEPPVKDTGQVPSKN